jgi:hypothetical protein
MWCHGVITYVPCYGGSDCVRCCESRISPWQVSNGVDHQSWRFGWFCWKSRVETLNNWTRVPLNRALGWLWMWHYISRISWGMKDDLRSCWDSQGVARDRGLQVKQVGKQWKNHVCQVRGRISQLDVGLSTQTIFFQICCIRFGRIGSFGCRFWVDSEVLKIEMWETLKKVEKLTYCARTVCCCMNFEHFAFFLNVVHVYQLAGHLDGGDIPLSHRKKNRRRYEKACKSWMKIRTQSTTSRLGIEK